MPGLVRLLSGALLVLTVTACAGIGSPPPSSRTSAPVETLCAPFDGPQRRTLPSGRSNEPVADVPKPAKGVAILDPTYGTCVVRVTDHATEPPVGFARHHYSRRQSFNADGSLLLVSAQDGFWHLYDARTLVWIARVPALAGEAEAQWHPTAPALMYYQARYGIGMTIRELNVRTGRTRVVGDLAARIRSVWPTAQVAWTRSEGSPSADGRYWCFMVDDRNWGGVGVVTWDRDTDTILGMMNTGGVRPDHVSMSPGGGYCVVSTDAAGIGTRAWTRDFKTSTSLHKKSEHSDLAVDENGRDVYVSIDYQSADGDVFMVDLETGRRTTLFKTYLDGTATALHISGRAFGRPGWVVVSTYADSRTSRQWLHRKIFAVGLTPNPVIRTLAHHQSRYKGYWTEPQASVDRNFTRLLFNSNWGADSDVDVDTYMIVLGPEALK